MLLRYFIRLMLWILQICKGSDRSYCGENYVSTFPLVIVLNHPNFWLIFRCHRCMRYRITATDNQKSRTRLFSTPWPSNVIIHLRVYKEALAAGMEPLSENGLCLSELELHGGGHLHESVAASVGSAISSLMAPLHHEPQHTPLHHAPPLHHEPLEKLKCKSNFSFIVWNLCPIIFYIRQTMITTCVRTKLLGFVIVVHRKRNFSRRSKSPRYVFFVFFQCITISGFFQQK